MLLLACLFFRAPVVEWRNE